MPTLIAPDGQRVAAQVASHTAVGAEKVFREVASGAKADRTQLRRLLDSSPPATGDGARLDRLARYLFRWRLSYGAPEYISGFRMILGRSRSLAGGWGRPTAEGDPAEQRRHQQKHRCDDQRRDAPGDRIAGGRHLDAEKQKAPAGKQQHDGEISAAI